MKKPKLWRRAAVILFDNHSFGGKILNVLQVNNIGSRLLDNWILNSAMFTSHIA